MNKFFGVIGALLMVAAVCIAEFCTLKTADVIEIALAAFGLASIIIGVINKAKKESTFSWKTVVVIVLAVVAGVLCCIGGLNQSIFAEIAGAVLALLTIILGIFHNK